MTNNKRLFSILSEHLNCSSMCFHRIMCHFKSVPERCFQTWCMFSIQKSKTHKALWFIQCKKVFNPVTKPFCHQCASTLIFSITTTSYSEAVVNVGYNELNFTLASAVRNYQLTFAATLLRSTSHAANSSRRLAMFSIVRDKHCLVITFRSISAMSSQFPCLGV